MCAEVFADYKQKYESESMAISAIISFIDAATNNIQEQTEGTQYFDEEIEEEEYTMNLEEGKQQKEVITQLGKKQTKGNF